MIAWTAKAKKSRPAPISENLYRCPGCGEMVNNRDVDAIRLHHQHVLRPRGSFVVTPFYERAETGLAR
jgi:hypothetical protein